MSQFDDDTRVLRDALIEAARAQARKARLVVAETGGPIGSDFDFILFCCATHEAVAALDAFEQRWYEEEKARFAAEIDRATLGDRP